MMVIVIQIIVPVMSAGVSLPFVPDVPEVAIVPKVAEVASVAENARVAEVASAHVVPFTAKLPRHRRRHLLLRVEQLVLDSSATASATSASGGMTPDVTPSYLLLRPSGDLAAGQPRRAWGPHDRSASDLLPPQPPGGLHHITLEGYTSWSLHDQIFFLHWPSSLLLSRGLNPFAYCFFYSGFCQDSISFRRWVE